MSEVKLKGDCIEFGASHKLDKNFFFYSKLNKDSKITFSNVKSNNKSFKIIDLTKKIKFSRYYDRIIIFNVLEHVSDLKAALKNLHRLLGKNGELIGSTPFLYRVHGAPKDYSRFTADFLYQEFRLAGFKNVKIEYLGYGPFLASFSIVHGILKFLPFIFTILVLTLIVNPELLSLMVTS
jgi:SAM-dependent methyltransferase